MLLLDYCKAFDLVNHSILLEKMQRAGTPACLVRWCAAFLLNHQQCVRVGCDLSDMVTLSGGVPQGTLLGPLAFILHLGDFDTPGLVEDCIHVDDTSCCLASSDPLDPHIQNAADYSEVWASLNDMRINAVKTKEMVFSFCRSLDLAPITIDNKVIERVAQSRLLGVTLCSNLSWKGHIDSVLSKCNQRLYLLLHLRRSGVPVADLLIIYKAIARSVLEYAAPVWRSPLPEYLSEELEQVQWWALQIIFGAGSYKDHLEAAGLPTLLGRRQLLCQAFYNKMNKPDNKLHHLLPMPKEHNYSLRHPRHLPEIPSRTKRFRNSFMPWAVRVFD